MSEALPGRRGLLRGVAGLLALGTAGCGFRPLYGEGAAGGEDPAIAEEFAATWVTPIPERFGQLLRRNLQQRLAVPGGRATAARWELSVAPNLAAEPIGILRDGSATRVRYIATANWTLRRVAPREAVANGFERAMQAYNLQPNQYFAGDISREATERRLAEQLAAEVTTRVALRFRTLREGAPTRLIEPVPASPAMPPPPAEMLVPAPSGGEPGGLGGGIGPGGPFPP